MPDCLHHTINLDYMWLLTLGIFLLINASSIISVLCTGVKVGRISSVVYVLPNYSFFFLMKVKQFPLFIRYTIVLLHFKHCLHILW